MAATVTALLLTFVLAALAAERARKHAEPQTLDEIHARLEAATREVHTLRKAIEREERMSLRTEARR